MAPRPRRTNTSNSKPSQAYEHDYTDSLLRPDVGTQAQFRKKKPPVKYRYDQSLDPEMSWDDNPAREQGEAFIAQLDEAAAQLAKATDPVLISTLQAQIRHLAAQLKAMSGPFLKWAGKAEHQEFSVPTLPLFVHERLSTKGILESVKRHHRDKQEELSFYGDEDMDITDRILKAYEHRAPWTNRLILGDSQVVMNSLLQYESLGGQVQMIYMDPPYGVKFGSNLQPFVRKRDVKHNDDQDMTREPETVKAYRDTWELGLHSYMTYLRDRLLLAKELLHPTGSIFVQISDENVHHVREVLDEVFDKENFLSLITFKKTLPLGASGLPTVTDYLL
jgi:adenine-specific DNA-methyltransferase